MSDISSLLRNGLLSTPEQHQIFVSSVMSAQNSERYNLSEEVLTFNPDTNSFVVFSQGSDTTVRLWDLNNLYIALFHVPETFSEKACYFTTSLKDVKCTGICFSDAEFNHAVEVLEQMGQAGNRTQFLESVVKFNQDHQKANLSPGKKPDEGRLPRRALKSPREAKPIVEGDKSPKRRNRSPRRAKSPEAKRSPTKERGTSSFCDDSKGKAFPANERSNLSVDDAAKAKKRSPTRSKSVRTTSTAKTLRKPKKEESEQTIVTFDGEDKPQVVEKKESGNERSNVSLDSLGKRTTRSRSTGKKRTETSQSELSSLIFDGDNPPGVTEKSLDGMEEKQKRQTRAKSPKSSKKSTSQSEQSSLIIEGEEKISAIEKSFDASSKARKPMKKVGDDQNILDDDDKEDTPKENKQSRQPLKLSPEDRRELIFDEHGQVQRRVVRTTPEKRKEKMEAEMAKKETPTKNDVDENEEERITSPDNTPQAKDEEVNEKEKNAEEESPQKRSEEETPKNYSTPKKRISKSPRRRKNRTLDEDDMTLERRSKSPSKTTNRTLDEADIAKVPETVPEPETPQEQPKETPESQGHVEEGEHQGGRVEGEHQSGRIILVKKDKTPLIQPETPEPEEVKEQPEPVEAKEPEPLEIKEQREVEEPPQPEVKKSPARRRVTRSPKRTSVKVKEEESPNKPEPEKKSPRKQRVSPRAVARRRRILPLEIGPNVTVEKIRSSMSSEQESGMSSESSLETIDALEAEINKLDLGQRQSIFDMQASEESSSGTRKRRRMRRDLMPAYARLTVSQRMRMLRDKKERQARAQEEHEVQVSPPRESEVRRMSLEESEPKTKDSPASSPDQKSSEPQKRIAFAEALSQSRIKSKRSLVDSELKWSDEPISASVFEPSIELDAWGSSDSGIAKGKPPRPGKEGDSSPERKEEQTDSLFSLLDDSSNFASSDLALPSKADPEDESSLVEEKDPIKSEHISLPLVIPSEGETTQFGTSGVAPFSTDSGLEYPMSNAWSLLRKQKDSDTSDEDATATQSIPPSQLSAEIPQ